ncbi:hypothetical protein KXP55_001004 [Staphylococcus pseudintermedius]|nr:hypothetical protein [Staphylococcus pseudintermedius]
MVIRQLKNFKRVTAPTTKTVTDFHRQDVTHAGRTIKNALNNKITLLNALSSHQPTLTKNQKDIFPQ